jgi:hypothetical protein
MAEQKMKVRDKQVQKMTKDGLVEKNLTNQTTVRVSRRAEDVRLHRNRSPDEKVNLEKHPEQAVRKKRQRTRYQPNSKGETTESVLKTSKDRESRLFEEEHAGLSESRGDSRKQKTGGTKRPKQKRRLQFQEAEKSFGTDEKAENTVQSAAQKQKVLTKVQLTLKQMSRK